MSDPRPPSDPLAAEIAAHHASDGSSCDRCAEDWPCLVRRLAGQREEWRDTAEARLALVARMQGRVREVLTERDALLAAGQAMADALEWVRATHQPPSAQVRDALDVWRILGPAPSDGES